MEITNIPKKKKKKKNQTLEGQFRYALDTCSKNNDRAGALSLYKTALSQNLNLNHYHFNTLLYLCSNSIPNPNPSQHSDDLDIGFRIFDHMISSNIKPTEATITAAARLAASKDDGDLAFEFVKTMGKYGISPKLRSYGPALLAFCRKMEAEKAYAVEEHMSSMGVVLEEPEISSLLMVSAELGREDKVYMYLQKLRNRVRCVITSTAEIIQNWFRSGVASEVGCSHWDSGRVKDAILKNGGGWHGLGWLGKGKWEVFQSTVSSEGLCGCCGEQLDCVDIDRMETEKFAESIALLAMEREVKSNFREFQEWLENHHDYEGIVDGANVGYYQQNFLDGGFSLSQLNTVVKELYERSQKKWPLVILHNKRVRALMEIPSNRQLLEEWKAHGALYTTPNGSNDDWYWLFAAVKIKCLLVTNDEMRDHIFELLGSNFFLKWKERHQVRFTFVKCDLRLQMPPSYSLVIQESEKGSWHVPIDGEYRDEKMRTWLCITRQKSCESSDGVLADSDATCPTLHCDQIAVCLQDCSASLEHSDDKTISLTGKRKNRSASPS